MLTAWVGTHPPPTLRQQVHLLTKSTVVKFIRDRPDQNKTGTKDHTGMTSSVHPTTLSTGQNQNWLWHLWRGMH
jgi:hypothetical protein